MTAPVRHRRRSRIPASWRATLTFSVSLVVAVLVVYGLTEWWVTQ